MDFISHKKMAAAPDSAHCNMWTQAVLWWLSLIFLVLLGISGHWEGNASRWRNQYILHLENNWDC